MPEERPPFVPDPIDPVDQPRRAWLAAWFGVPNLWALAVPVPALVVLLATGSWLWAFVALAAAVMVARLVFRTSRLP